MEPLDKSEQTQALPHQAHEGGCAQTPSSLFSLPGLPQRAAQRISELNRFLYFRISGVSL